MIAHTCGDYKLELKPLCAWAPSAASAVGTSPYISGFALETNPCSPEGLSGSACDADPQCHWCGNFVRYRFLDSPCTLKANSTKALVARARYSCDPSGRHRLRFE